MKFPTHGGALIHRNGSDFLFPAKPSFCLVFQIFRRIDVDKSGWIDVFELQTALRNSSYNYDLHNVQILMRNFSGRLNSSLNEASFTALYTWLTNITDKFEAQLQPNCTSIDRETAKRLLGEVLQAELAKFNANIDPQHYQIDSQAFDAFLDSSDPNQDSSIDASEFVRSAALLRSALSVFVAFDRDKDGVITLKFSQLLFGIAHLL